jgi:23S rRNA pseudouridine2604 synthase|tara:strand:+ start:2007 stop:2741 length:735 start_codon:yes stop_codon:yes gene_type:complete
MAITNENSTSLNKFISDSGFCSRREADVIIKAGRVTINGVVASSGNRVADGNEVLLDGKEISTKPKEVYIALNKPIGITCTTDMRVGGNIIEFMDYNERIFPIGRLDKPSEGLILLTNDGDIVNKILRASNNHEKEYIVEVNKPVSKDFLLKMGDGVLLPELETTTRKCKIERIGKFKFKIILTQGLNRQIRRMCENLGYRVLSLKRVRIMNIKIDQLATGNWRHLTHQEMKQLDNLLEGSAKN